MFNKEQGLQLERPGVLNHPPEQQALVRLPYQLVKEMDLY
jgi:hypothetical protein